MVTASAPVVGRPVGVVVVGELESTRLGLRRAWEAPTTNHAPVPNRPTNDPSTPGTGQLTHRSALPEVSPFGWAFRGVPAVVPRVVVPVAVRINRCPATGGVAVALVCGATAPETTIAVAGTG